VTACALAGCIPPASPGPVETDPVPGRGRVPGVDVAPSAGCTAEDRWGPGNRTAEVRVGQRVRRVRVTVPDGWTGPRPLLFSLHPFSVRPSDWERYSRLAAAAAARGYVVITPTGSAPGPRWAVPGGLDTGADDLGYLAAAADLVEDHTCVDRNRLFAAGFSAGAAMSQALSCTMPWRVAAVAASGGANLTDRCPGSAPTDVLVLHGSADPIAPTTGSRVIFAPPLGLSLDDVVATNAARAGCAATPETEVRSPTVRIDRYTGCAGGHRVESWRLLGMGHTWPGSTNPLLELVTGPTSTEVSANEVVLDFFDATRPLG
jgi:polyhydroxybutyrate depolymerase